MASYSTTDLSDPKSETVACHTYDLLAIVKSNQVDLPNSCTNRELYRRWWLDAHHHLTVKDLKAHIKEGDTALDQRCTQCESSNSRASRCMRARNSGARAKVVRELDNLQTTMVSYVNLTFRYHISSGLINSSVVKMKTSLFTV